MTINRYTIYQVLALLFNPFINFILSLYYMFKGKKINVFLFSLSIAIILIYSPIMYDTAFNFVLNEIYKSNFSNYFTDIKFYNSIILILEKQLSVNYMTIMLGTYIIIIYIWIHISLTYAKSTIFNWQYQYILIIMLSFIIFRNVTDINRFYLSISLIFFLFFYLNNIKKKYSLLTYLLIIFILFISISMHSGSSFIIFLMLLSYFISNNTIYKKLPLLFLFLFLFSNLFLNSIIHSGILSAFFEETQIGKVTKYVSVSEFGQAKIQGRAIIIRAIEVLLFILIYIKGLTLLNNKNTFLIRLALLSILFCLLFFNYRTLYERYSLLALLFSSFIYYQTILINKKDLLLTLLLVLFILRSIAINIGVYGYIFTSDYNHVLPNENNKMEMFWKPFYYPSFILIDIEDNGYSNKYIKKESIRGVELYEWM
jgi:hypothetical protein